MAANTVSPLVLAKLFGVTDRYIQKLAKEGVIPKAERGKYDLARCVQAYVKYLQDRAFGKDPSVAGLTDARGRLVAAKAEREALELAVLKGQLVQIDDVIPAIEQEYTRCRQRLLSIPTKAAPQVAHMTNPGQVAEYLKQAISEALSELVSDTTLRTRGTGRAKK